MKLTSPNLVYQFGGVECSLSEFRFPVVHSINVEDKERQYQLVISPSLCSFHGCSDHDIMEVLPMADDIVNQMPLLGPGMHSCSPLLVCQSEECVNDDKVIFSTQFE